MKHSNVFWIKSHLHSLDGEAAGSCLPREHDAVSAVQHGVGDISGLSTRGARVLDHALQHLGRRDDWLAALQPRNAQSAQD